MGLANRFQYKINAAKHSNTAATMAFSSKLIRSGCLLRIKYKHKPMSTLVSISNQRTIAGQGWSPSRVDSSVQANQIISSTLACLGSAILAVAIAGKDKAIKPVPNMSEIARVVKGC